MDRGMNVGKMYEALRRSRQEAGKTNPFEPGAGPRRYPLNTPEELALGELSASITNTLFGSLRRVLDGRTEGAILHFVAATPGEGTSTLAREFAFVAATTGHRDTLLLDGDATSMTTARFFGCPVERGIADMVSQGAPYDEVLRPLGNTRSLVGALAGMGAGSQLDARDVRTTYNEVRKRFELTVVDCPAVAEGTYSNLLPEATDGIILVIQAEKVRPAAIQHTKGLIEQAGGHFLGAILNKRQNYIPKFLYGLL